MKELAKSGLYEITQKESEEMKAWWEEELAKRAKDKNSREIALRMLNEGIDVDTVVRLTKLRKSSMEKMKRETLRKKAGEWKIKRVFFRWDEWGDWFRFVVRIVVYKRFQTTTNVKKRKFEK